ncbi:MAG: hypothetical protein AAGD09_21965 [Cyanobacteria bacterium P01_F01_bin.56]
MMARHFLSADSSYPQNQQHPISSQLFRVLGGSSRLTVAVSSFPGLAASSL